MNPKAHERWVEKVKAMLSKLDWPAGKVVARAHATGASLAFTAPLDRLYSATEVNEWAWLSTCLEMGMEDLEIPLAPGYPSLKDSAQAASTLLHLAKVESQSNLLALVEEATAHSLPWLMDDDMLSLGAGQGSRGWSKTALPERGEVKWEELHSIPIALVTGTNGKTTSVRLSAAMCAAQGWLPGHTCTDGVFVGGEWLEAGDYSGPVGARQILRHPKVQAAILETARGGILRRGLPVQRAQAALVTNVTEDHFGEYGMHRLEDLAEAKLSVARALGSDGLLVLNADSPTLREQAGMLDVPLGWFALDDTHPLLEQHRQAGGSTCAPREGRLRLHAGGLDFDLGTLAAMPITAGGAARYNIANAAGASLLAMAMGVEPARIAEVLNRFGQKPSDNPGRLEHRMVKGTQVLLDYAHNPEGLQGLLAVAGSLRTHRLGLLLGQAGDRDDGAIRALAAVAASAHPDQVVLKDLEGYMRGREAGAVPALLADELMRQGVPASRIETLLSEVAAAKALLAWARPGDVVVLPIHNLEARRKLALYLDHLPLE